MTSRNKKRGNGTSKELVMPNAISSKLEAEEKVTLEKTKEFLVHIKKKYEISDNQVIQLILEKERLIPISIYTEKISILEATVKYLKENLSLNYHQIGCLLNRNERNIWHTFSAASKKHPESLTIDETKYFVPISIFQDRRPSILESLTKHLKEKMNLSYHEIAVLLKRDDRTIWTTYNRLRKKKEALIKSFI